MEEEYINEKIAKHIFSDILQRSFKVLCWGIRLSSISVIDKGVQFEVMAQVIHGRLKIQYQQWNDTYQISLLPYEIEAEEFILEDVKRENVVSVLDGILQYGYGCEKTRNQKLAEVV